MIAAPDGDGGARARARMMGVGEGGVHVATHILIVQFTICARTQLLYGVQRGCIRLQDVGVSFHGQV